MLTTKCNDVIQLVRHEFIVSYRGKDRDWIDRRHIVMNDGDYQQARRDAMKAGKKWADEIGQPHFYVQHGCSVAPEGMKVKFK